MAGTTYMWSLVQFLISVPSAGTTTSTQGTATAPARAGRHRDVRRNAGSVSDSPLRCPVARKRSLEHGIHRTPRARRYLDSRGDHTLCVRSQLSTWELCSPANLQFACNVKNVRAVNRDALQLYLDAMLERNYTSQYARPQKTTTGPEHQTLFRSSLARLASVGG